MMVARMMERTAIDICKRYMQRWFRSGVLCRVRRQTKRVIYLAAFHKWMLLGLRNITLRCGRRTLSPHLQAVVTVGQHCTSRPFKILAMLAATQELPPEPSAAEADVPPQKPAQLESCEPGSSSGHVARPLVLTAEQNVADNNDEEIQDSGGRRQHTCRLNESHDLVNESVERALSQVSEHSLHDATAKDDDNDDGDEEYREHQQQVEQPHEDDEDLLTPPYGDDTFEQEEVCAPAVEEERPRD
jgi:hypothetical protein